MPIVGISITKEVAFRNSVQPFSNVYFYNNGVGSVPSVAAANAMIDEVTETEKDIHSIDVTFTFGRLWHQTLTQIGTVMISQKALSGAGRAALVASMDKERAFLIQWRAGVDSRGNPVRLKKWFHTCGFFHSAGPVNQSVLENEEGISGGQIGTIEAKANELTSLSAGGGGWELCAKSGRGHDGLGAKSHPFLEHHQLGDQWRGG